MNKQTHIINIINKFIEDKTNSDKREFCLWKNKNKLFCIETFSDNSDNYHSVSFSFFNEEGKIEKLKEKGIVEIFSNDFISFQVSKEEVELIGSDIVFIETKDIPDWKYIKGSYSELIMAPTIRVEKGLESLISAMQDYFNLEDYSMPEMYSMNIEEVLIEIIYENVDSNFKWGDITGRIIFNGEVIGHYNRNGRYMEDYEYYTHDLIKWKEMLKIIESKLKIEKEEFCDLNIFNKEDDIYAIANIAESKG